MTSDDLTLPRTTGRKARDVAKKGLRRGFELGQRLAVDHGHGLAPRPTGQQKREEKQTTAKDNHVSKGRQSTCPLAGLRHSKQIVHV